MTESEMKAQIEQYQPGFESLIQKRLGIAIYHQIAELQKTLLSACKKFHCAPREYLEKLQTCPDDSPYLEHLVLGITVGETYFFRDLHQVDLLRSTVLPRLIQKKRDSHQLSLRIWSAGCASGEEIYTLAMMLRELISDIDQWTIHLLATDINTAALQKAVQAIYTEWSMRTIPPIFKQRYFVKDKLNYHLVPSIKEAVTFRFLNLNDNVYPSIFNGTNAQDLILCRNVLIYFDSVQIKALMQRFSRSLSPDGFLLLGAADPVELTDTCLALFNAESMLFCNQETMASPLLPKAVIPFVVPPVVPTLSISLPEKSDPIALLNTKAFAYANLGQLDQALQCCHASLALETTQPLTYFTYALVLGELNRYDESEAALRKTLFLDRQFAAAHFRLGLLLIKNKRERLGVKCLKNALAIAIEQDPAAPVPGSSGVTYGKLAEILEHELALYE